MIHKLNLQFWNYGTITLEGLFRRFKYRYGWFGPITVLIIGENFTTRPICQIIQSQFAFTMIVEILKAMFSSTKCTVLEM